MYVSLSYYFANRVHIEQKFTVQCCTVLQLSSSCFMINENLPTCLCICVIFLYIHLFEKCVSLLFHKTQGFKLSCRLHMKAQDSGYTWL